VVDLIRVRKLPQTTQPPLPSAYAEDRDAWN
jgi:hypothetical protein